MVSLDLWRYELDFLNITAVGATTDEIKSLYPWLRKKGFTTKDFEKYAYYDMKELILILAAAVSAPRAFGDDIGLK